MNPRIQFYERNSKLVCAFDRSEFPYDRTDNESRRAALDKLDAHGTKVIAQLEAQAGRPLNGLELIHGVEHLDTRTRDERVAEITAKRLEEKQKETVRFNPYRAALEAGEVDPPKKETRKEMYERRSREWDEQQKTADEQRARLMDQARQRFVTEAEKELLAMRYDPKITLVEISKAELRLELARSGDLIDYKREVRDWNAIKQARLEGKSAAIDEQIAELQKRKADFNSAAASAPDSPSDGQWTDNLNVVGNSNQ